MTLAGIGRRIRGLRTTIACARLRARGVRIGRDVVVGRRVVLRRNRPGAAGGCITVGDGCDLGGGCVLEAWGGSITLARRVYLGEYAVIYGHGGVTIGEETLIAMHCRIVSSNHAIPPAGVDIRSRADIPLPVTIGRDVWLAAGVTVLGGVTIGDGCVVGAGAVVTRSLPPNSIALGAPARVVRQRPVAA